MVCLDANTFVGRTYPSLEPVRSIAHEMAHAFQERAVAGEIPETENVVFRGTDADDVEKWGSEFERYVTCDESGYDAYAGQAVERTARRYSSLRTRAYETALRDAGW